MTIFQTIMTAVRDARAGCQADAERQRRDFRFQQWRQTELVGANSDGRVREPIFFDSTHRLTKANLRDGMRYLAEHGANSFSLQGGIDGGDRMSTFADGDYSPYIAEWEVDLDPFVDDLGISILARCAYRDCRAPIPASGCIGVSTSRLDSRTRICSRCGTREALSGEALFAEPRFASLPAEATQLTDEIRASFPKAAP
jgi:hypothetical protein